jgi:serine/threonine protein kinase
MSSTADWEQLKALFHEALELPVAARAAFLRQRTTDDRTIREVESLLAAHPHAEGFLSTPAAAADDEDASPRLVCGTRLGPFEILELIGAGGMGEVYRARDTRLDRTVALKVIARDLVNHREGRERFEREARAVSQLAHPRVCTLHDVGTTAVGGVDLRFLVMELVEGETLAARLSRGAIPLDSAIATGLETLEALVAAHAAGIVHRDLKPANIMLTKTGVKLLDFGLARLRPSALDPFPDMQSDPLTLEGAIVGTVPYMAPEQLQGKDADVRSDLFAFGAVFYEMLTGVRAFDADSQAALIAAILEHEPAPLTTRQPLAPPALGRLVTTCLAKDPDDRWPRARDVMRELTWIRDGAPAGQVPVARARRRWRVPTWVSDRAGRIGRARGGLRRPLARCASNIGHNVLYLSA